MVRKEKHVHSKKQRARPSKASQKSSASRQDLKKKRETERLPQFGGGVGGILQQVVASSQV